MLDLKVCEMPKSVATSLYRHRELLAPRGGSARLEGGQGGDCARGQARSRVGLMRDPACLCAARANAGSSGSIVMRPIHERMGWDELKW